MRLVYRRDAEVAAWVAERFGGALHARGFGLCKAIGVANGADEMVGGVVYNNWIPEQGVIEMTALGDTPQWLRPQFVARFVSYPFDELGCDVIVARASARNGATLRWARAAGADVVEAPNLGGLGHHIAVCTLTKSAFMASKIGRRLHGLIT